MNIAMSPGTTAVVDLGLEMLESDEKMLKNRSKKESPEVHGSSWQQVITQTT